MTGSAATEPFPASTARPSPTRSMRGISAVCFGSHFRPRTIRSRLDRSTFGLFALMPAPFVLFARIFYALPDLDVNIVILQKMQDYNVAEWGRRHRSSIRGIGSGDRFGHRFGHRFGRGAGRG